MHYKLDLAVHHQVTIVLALIAATLPITSMAAAGRVEFAIGDAKSISADGEIRQLVKGADINSGDTIKTTEGRVQVRFTDGGYMSFQPNTEFKIENYHYEGKQDGSEKGFFSLVEGGLRAITGMVGRNNRPAYRVATPVATIGIRGSEFLGEYRMNKLNTRVTGGSIFIENQFGNLILFKGQSAEALEGQKPKYSEEQSGVLARGPSGGKPAKTEKEFQGEEEIKTIYSSNELYGEDGELFQIAGEDSPGDDGPLDDDPINDDPLGNSNIIAQYAAANAVGQYTGSSNVISGLKSNFTGSAVGSLTANFGKYEVVNNLSVNIVRNDIGGSQPTPFDNISASFTGTGGIGADGSILIPNMSITQESVLCSSGCNVSGTGSFSGAAAEFAEITYGISGVSNSLTETGSVGTTVMYNSTNLITPDSN